MQPWLKLAALVLVVAALGLPVNDLFRYALLAEGHTVLLIDDAGVSARGRTDRGGALEAGLPRAAFQLMVTEFNTI